MKRKLFGGLLCTAMLCLFISIAAMADVAIDENNFPDVNFRAFVRGYDSDKSGALSTSEFASITKINCSNKNISDLTGIEYFTSLQELLCHNNNLTSLNISKNTKLTDLICGNNSLRTLDVSSNPNLRDLICRNNQLTRLTAGNNPYLVYIRAWNNNLAELDISKCSVDLNLYVSHNPRTLRTDSENNSDYDSWIGTGIALCVDQYTFVNYVGGTSEAGVKLITVTTDGNGTASASASKGHTFDEVTLTATPNNGYKFKEWETTGGITVTDNKFKIGDQHVGIKAIFEQVPSDAPAELDAEAILDAVAGSLSENGDPVGSSFRILQVKAKKVKKTSITLGWKAVPKAAGYVIYGAPCGSKYAKLTTTKGTNFTQSKLKKGKYYKYFVSAYDKNGNILASSKTVHIATSGGKKGNTKSVKLNKKKKTLKVGKTFKLKAKLKNGKLKVSKHRKVAYESDNPKVATVSKSGKVKAVGKGTCYVYAYAQNGVFAKCKVTVK